jgi:hypothetical protein
MKLFGKLFKKPLPLVPSQEGKHKNSNQKKNFTFFYRKSNASGHQFLRGERGKWKL